MLRRHAVIHAAASASALFGIPVQGWSARTTPLPDPALARSDSDKYWSRIRNEQFLLPGWRAFLNNGSLGLAPRPVLQTVIDYLENSAALILPEGEYPRWGYETLDAHREEVAAYVGCQKDELAFTHNATEALSTIANGIDLNRGDEVVMTDQEHTSGKAAWALQQARRGIVVREVKIPLPPKDPAQLADLMISSIGPKTRVLFFSSVLSFTGILMPVAEICRAARAKGIITVVDGAHMNGQVATRISDLECDYYAGSPHKWMFAPAGCGILYGRLEMLDRLWPSIVTGNWDDKSKKAARFMQVGTNNRAIFEGMVAGVRFARSLGADSVFQRIHSLARKARAQAAELGMNMITPDDDRMYGGLVSFEYKGVNLDKIMNECTRRRIWIVRGPRIRISTHIHTRPQDLDMFFEIVKEARV